MNLFGRMTLACHLLYDESMTVSYTIAMVAEYVTDCYLYSAHKLCQITWHSGLSAQLEQHIIVGICCLSQTSDKHGCWSQHVSNSNSTSIKHLSLLPSPTASSQPTLPHSTHHLLSIIHHQWQLPISSLLNPPCLDFPNIHWYTEKLTKCLESNVRVAKSKTE